MLVIWGREGALHRQLLCTQTRKAGTGPGSSEHLSSPGLGRTGIARLLLFHPLSKGIAIAAKGSYQLL